MRNNTPRIGQTYRVHGVLGIIVAVHRAGTIDVETPDGRWWRVTGLTF